MKTSLSLCYFALGSDIHTRRWCTAMAEFGHRVTLVPQEGCEIKPLNGVTIRRDPIPSCLAGKIHHMWWTAINAHRIRKMLYKCRVDVYHMHWFWTGLLPRYIMAGLSPLIISVWGKDIIADNTESILEQRAKRLGLAQANLICATTHFLKNHTQRYCKPNRLIQVAERNLELQKGTY